MWTAQDFTGEHVGQIDIGAELRPSGHFVNGVDLGDALSDDAEGLGWRIHTKRLSIHSAGSRTP
jgi:hypothetical protein